MTAEFEQLVAALNNINSGIQQNRQVLEKILAKQQDKEESEDKLIANQVIIPAHDITEFEAVNNPKYNRARVFLNALFTPAHSGGLTVELFYGNNKIGDVMRLKSSNGSGASASEPFDIAHLSSFKFIIRNNDQSNATTIRNLKVIMYNELITFENRLGDQ